MSYNDCFGQDSPQLPEQGQQGRFLFQCPCVRGYAAGRQAPFITDADRMPVVVLAVRSDSLQRASAVNPAVARDVEMVTDILETAVVDMVYNILAVGDSTVRKTTFSTRTVNMRPEIQQPKRRKAA